MHKTIISGVFALCAATAVASAQQPPSPTPAPNPTTSPQPSVPAPQRTAPNPDVVTFEGCVQRGMAATSATPGAVGTSGTGSYVLAQAKKSAPGDTRSASPSVGTAGTTAATAANAGAAYRLEADEATLSPHVGHKVEVTGMLNDSANTDTTSGNVARTSGNSASLKVESIRMVSATCAP